MVCVGGRAGGEGVRGGGREVPGVEGGRGQLQSSKARDVKAGVHPHLLGAAGPASNEVAQGDHQ